MTEFEKVRINILEQQLSNLTKEINEFKYETLNELDRLEAIAVSFLERETLKESVKEKDEAIDKLLEQI